MPDAKPRESAPIVAAIPPPGSDSGTASPPRVPEPPPALADSSPSSLQVTSVLAADDDPPSTPPAKRRLTTVLLPIAVGGAVAVAIGIFALWPRDRSDADPDTAVPTVVDSPASSADESVNTVDSGSEPTVATEPTRDAVTTTAEPVVTAQPGPAEAFLVATVDVDATTNVDGFEFTAIDGLGYDPVGGRMLAAREAAPLAEQEANPSLATPAVFAVPLILVGPQSATLDFSSASAAPLVDASGEPYGPELDLEGMVGLGDGSFYVVSEGSTESGGLSSTFVHRFDPDARFQSALLLPDWYVSNPETQTGFSPEQGLHGIDQRPGSAGQVVVAVEAPLLQDHDPDQPTESKVARLIAFDIETGVPTAEWAYPLDLISPTVAAAEPTAASLIIDIAALGDDSIVVLESTRTEAGRQVALYRVVLDAGSTPGPETPAPLQKSPIAVSGMDSLSQFRSISAGPTLPDGEPSLLLATDNAFDGSPTQIAILSVDEES